MAAARARFGASMDRARDTPETPETPDASLLTEALDRGAAGRRDLDAAAGGFGPPARRAQTRARSVPVSADGVFRAMRDDDRRYLSAVVSSG